MHKPETSSLRAAYNVVNLFILKGLFMPQITASYINELEKEGATTRRLLERVPDGKLDWQPSPKSMTLKRMALHVAETPGAFAHILLPDERDFATLDYTPPEAGSTAEILAVHDKSITAAKQFLAGLSDERALANCKFTRAGTELWSAPRIGWVRALMLNHWYHHRGQLSVYLRILGVPIPSIYGPSGDEDLFAA